MKFSIKNQNIIKIIYEKNEFTIKIMPFPLFLGKKTAKRWFNKISGIMNLKDYLNEIQDFDDASQRELLADFQNGNFLDFSEVMQQSTRSFQDFLNTGNGMPQPIRLGETVRGMNNVSPLLAVKFKNQKSKDISDKYFIDAFKDQYNDFDIVIDPGCTVNEEYLNQNFTKKTSSYFIDDDGKKGETSGDTKVNFIIFITKDENKIREAYQCLKPSKNEIILFVEDNTGDNNGQLILTKADESVKKFLGR